MSKQLAKTPKFKQLLTAFFITSYQHPKIDSLQPNHQILRDTITAFDLDGHTIIKSFQGPTIFFIFLQTVLHTVIPKRLLVQLFLDNTYLLNIFNQGQILIFCTNVGLHYYTLYII